MRHQISCYCDSIGTNIEGINRGGIATVEGVTEIVATVVVATVVPATAVVARAATVATVTMGMVAVP